MREVEIRETKLSDPDTINWPNVSLSLMVKNGESCVGRLLDSLLVGVDGRRVPCIREVVAVLNDTTDNTGAIIEKWCAEHRRNMKIFEVTDASNPEFYILDSKKTYEVGKPLADETFSGPFLEAPILADWSSARNIGWSNCAGDWKLFLDADDVVMDPHAIPGLVAALEENERDLAITKYEWSVGPDGRARSSSLRERLARNVPNIRWGYPIHECIIGARAVAHIDGTLIVRDMRDNRGAGVRVPGRNFKILYYNARLADWEVSPRTLVNLLMETRHMVVPSGAGVGLAFAEKLLETYLARSDWHEERGWALALMGEIYDKEERWEDASAMYVRSLDEHPGAKTAFRLAKSRFMQQDWRGTVDAYDLGVENARNVHQALDDGEAFEDITKILVASALKELGHPRRAQEVCRQALEIFPNTSALIALGKDIDDSVAKLGSDEQILERGDKGTVVDFDWKADVKT